MESYHGNLERKLMDKFPDLLDVHVHEAVYSRAERVLKLEILVKCVPKDEEEVRKFVASLLPVGCALELKITKSYIDEEFLRQKLDKYYEKSNTFLKSVMPSVKTDVEFSGDKVTITLHGEESFCVYVENSMEKSLLKYLRRSFINEFEIKLSPEKAEKKDEENVPVFEPTRAVPVYDVTQYINKVDDNLPAFIMDVDNDYDYAVLCGVVTNLVQREKKVKKEGKNPFYYTFTLTDVSGSINCVMFPSKANDRKALALEEREIVASGSIRKNTFKKDLEMQVRSASLCRIDKGIEKPKEKSRAVPAFYKVLKFEQALRTQQSAMFSDAEEKRDTSRLRGKTVVVFDLETTGIDTETAKIVEIAAIKLVDGKYTEQFSILINPQMSIPEGASAVNHITDEMVRFSPIIDDVIGDIYKFCYGAILCGHNARDYDMKILRREGKRAGFVFDNEVWDTLLLAKKYVPTAANYKLATLLSHFGLENAEAHRSMGDTAATAELLVALLPFMSEIA